MFWRMFLVSDKIAWLNSPRVKLTPERYCCTSEMNITGDKGDWTKNWSSPTASKKNLKYLEEVEYFLTVISERETFII